MFSHQIFLSQIAQSVYIINRISIGKNEISSDNDKSKYSKKAPHEKKIENKH